MLVVVALGDDAVLPRAEALDLEERANTGGSPPPAAVAGDPHLVVTYGFGQQLGPPSLERAIACRLPGDGLATVPARVVVDADDSLRPRSIVDLRTFRILVDSGVTVLCAGDACFPVVRTPAGGLRVVDVVVDGDLAAMRLATELDTDALLLLTGAAAGRDDPVGVTAAKVRAVRDFVAAGGWLGAVGPLPDAAAMLRGEAGLVEWGAGAAPPVAVPGG
jgi:carbamate kinase